MDERTFGCKDPSRPSLTSAFAMPARPNRTNGVTGYPTIVRGHASPCPLLTAMRLSSPRRRRILPRGTTVMAPPAG